ncbi:MAG: hypothetical protein HDS84_01620 [Bacteroidales bacterium]|nr:hypothetical protein [Bacteroidales bacterium]MBD5205064.1 hypothetical protein [Bacteroidales bacterium]
MKKFLTGVVAMTTILALAFTSCKSGDDDDFEPLSPEDKVLVSSDVPSEGWSGNTDNGILKYAPSEYDNEDINTYFAFNMKNGVCDNAVINIVLQNSVQAKQLAQMLNNGTWIEEEEDDDDDYAYSNRSKSQSRSFDITNSLLKCISRANASRAGVTLPIPVQQEGKVIYVVLTNFKGLHADDIKTAVDLWSGNSYTVPDRVIFGTYVNGVYTCKNMHGMNIDYLVETKFNNSGICTKYTTTITLPDENWAAFYYEAYEEQLWDFEQQFGQRPDLKLTGKTVILDALIMGDITREQVNSIIYSLDWLNNCPFIYKLFG